MAGKEEEPVVVNQVCEKLGKKAPLLPSDAQTTPISLVHHSEYVTWKHSAYMRGDRSACACICKEFKRTARKCTQNLIESIVNYNALIEDLD